MKLLVLGGGGREHALAWKLAQAQDVSCVYVAPGNAGTAREARLLNVELNPMDFPAIAEFVDREGIALSVVGPEAPLVAGVVDFLSARGHRCLGPSAAAARLEGSKTFSKDFMARHGIPTAAYASFTEIEPALAYLRAQGAPIVVKADGLAAGKGVIVAETLQQAEAAVTAMLRGDAFGDAGCRVVIEEVLHGEEASFIVLSDGRCVLPMASSQDHKRVGEGDTGPNTGGMGAYSPAPAVTAAVHERIMEDVIRPTIRAMASEGHPYRGFLYAGLMIAADGSPKVIEFNCRCGDPETQPVMRRLNSDLQALCRAAVDGRLSEHEAVWDPRHAIGVVLAAAGYPGAYARGLPISGLEAAADRAVKIFHAGTAQHPESDTLVTSGGRVLCVTALGETIIDARARCYAAVDAIHWEGLQCRRDIGWRAVERYNHLP